MNNLVSALLQTSLSSAFLFLIYYAFLRRDTFFKTNRFYLVVALALSAIIPFIDFEFLLSSREQIYLVLLEPVVITPEGIQTTIEQHTGVFQIGFAVYLTGIFIFSFRFLYQLVQLYYLTRKFGISRQSGLSIVFTTKNISPFSFFNLVFFNRDEIDSPESQKIIAHERVHIRQLHSLDLILLELITIIQWFNPFIWFYRHEVKTLHEYLADEGVLHSGVDANVYSALLFQQSTGIQINDLTNNFSKSLLKRRFTMMTKNKSKKLSRLKLLFVLPLALSMLLFISFSTDVIAQQEEQVVPPPPPKNASTNDQAIAKTEKSEVLVIQEVPQEGEKKKAPIFTVVEEMPKYAGGFDKMYEFLGENIKYPQKAKEEGISGTVYISFVVEKDGKPTNFKVLRGVNEELDAEALRVMKLMPNWEPGKQDGKAVRVQYNLPIKFVLNKEEKKEE